MNILVSSAGRRVKIVEYMKKALDDKNGKVIAIDCDSQAPALYFADNYEIVPKINNPVYIDTLLSICEKYNIDGVISLIDPELEILAKNKLKFEERSIKLVLSPLDVIQKSFDKFKTHNWLTNINIPTVPTYKGDKRVLKLIEEDKLSFPLVVKPAKGSASLGIFVVYNLDDLRNTLKKSNEFITQPYYKEKEYGIDAYIDMMNGDLVDLFIKEKVKMRSGETDKSISTHNEEITRLVKDFISKASFKGPVDIDCFEYKGNYYISEINPRFGGGFPHAYEMGCDYMKYILKNIQGKNNSPFYSHEYKENYVMMKHDCITLIHNEKK